MPSAVWCRPAPSGLLLLLLLWVVSLCGAVEVNSSLSAALSRPAEILGQAAQSALLSLASELEGRLEGQLGQLEGRLDQLEGRLEGRLGQLSSRLAAVQAESSAGTRRLSRDCSDLPSGARSGIHLLQPGLDRSQPPTAAYCDLDSDGGGWTVIQRRADIQPRQSFFLGWQAYREGFGELDAEFWWGLESLWAMTSSRDRRYELRIDLADFEGNERFAVYQGFRVSSEGDGYRLTAVNYTGTAGDSIGGHSGMMFSTVDRDQDIHGKASCAKIHKAGWWYSACHVSNLNGPYLAGQHDSYADGINWLAWKGYHYSLKTVTMKIRPTRKLL